MSCKDSCTWIPCFSYFYNSYCPIWAHEKGAPMLPMLSHAVCNKQKCSTLLSMLFHAIWSDENKELPCSPCFPMLSEIMRNNPPCFPCFSMLFKIIRRWCPMVSMLIPCSTDVAWKYSMLSMLPRAFAEHGKARETWGAWGDHPLQKCCILPLANQWHTTVNLP